MEEEQEEEVEEGEEEEEVGDPRHLVCVRPLCNELQFAILI